MGKLLLLYCVAASVLGLSSALYEDCEIPPSVKHAAIKIEDEEDVIRAIYTCKPGFELNGPKELLCDLDTDEWNADPPKCVISDAANEVDGDAKAKNKLQDIPEDRYVSPALASTLDMTCVQAKVKAPEIRHGFVQNYEKRSKTDRVFLVAHYGCKDNFEFEDSNTNTLYCSERKWVGELPVCVSVGEYIEGDDEEEYEEYEEEGENNETPTSISATDTTHTDNTESAEDPEEGPSNEISNNENKDISGSEVTNQITTGSETVEMTAEEYAPRFLDDNCGSDKGGCDHKCERLQFPGESEPRLRCSCFDGFQLDSNDDSTCHDIDECAENNGGCEELCQNFPGSFRCACQAGLQIDTLTGTTCVDINECEIPEIAAECSDGCENTQGSYRCITALNTREDVEQHSEQSETETGDNTVCGEGYRSQDGECIDIDECSEGTSGCQQCINTEGGYECTCPQGFDLAEDEKTCIDIDECSIVIEENEDEASYRLCSHGCQNTIGSFSCNCPPRMHLSDNSRTCLADSCSDLQNSNLNKTRCSYDCVDLPNGGYDCLCPEGYALANDGINCDQLEDTRVDICTERNGAEKCYPGTCQSYDDNSDFICVCPTGFKQEEKRCLDVDECSGELHECSHECMNTEGGYRCICPEGYQFNNGNDRECIDIDECRVDPDICGALQCVNYPGSFNCLCEDGKEPNDEGICPVPQEDSCASHRCSHECIPEGQSYRCACPDKMSLDQTGENCVASDLCSVNKNGCEHLCNSQEGGTCSCYDGYALDSNGKSCNDIDECLTNRGGCHQLCTNSAGSYTCDCEVGFELADDKKTCLDIDECSMGRHECSHMCENVEGSFQCVCPDGYYLGEGGTKCLDVDECIVSDHGCSHQCYNTMGSYICACPEGQSLSEDGKTCLNSLCTVQNGGCSHSCDEVKGCTCPTGYILGDDEKTCDDIDECANNNGGCSFKCLNLLGSFECICPDNSKPGPGEACPLLCPAGFTFSQEDPSQCVDINECELPGVCQFNCRNTNGSYECLCPPGYKLMNGRNCIDVDECLVNNGGCVNGQCVNHNGGHECRCHMGYRLTGDRRTCEKHTELRDHCPPFQAPLNGAMHCTKYRHKKKLFYNTRCKLWCNQGYRLEGPSEHYCNASGQWDDNRSRCVPITCPRIPIPTNGVMLPSTCSLGKTFVGERCRLQCHAGLVPVGKSVAVCTSQMQWSYNGTFECTPKQIETRLGTASNGFTPLILQTLPTLPPLAPLPTIPLNRFDMRPSFGLHPRPFIKCPRNTTVYLTNGERTKHIILQKPITNMDYRYIESSPAWAKDLQAVLGAGSYVVSFRGYDPVTSKKARCKTVINVKHAETPKIEFCTPSFEVALRENQVFRSVKWEEPRFAATPGGNIKQIDRSRIPGELFGVGEHNVFYRATNENGFSAVCEFKIIVIAATSSSVYPTAPTLNLEPPHHTARSANLIYAGDIQPAAFSPVSHPSIGNAHLLAGHESFIVCPGQKPVKVTQAQTIDLPANCVLKNIRKKSLRQFMPRHLTSGYWSSYMNF